MFIYGRSYLKTKEKTGYDLTAWPLMLGLLWASLAGWARLVISLRDWYWYDRFGLQPGPGYLAVSGAVWGLVGLAALLWLGQRARGYTWAGRSAVVFLALTYWGDRLAFSRPDGAWVNLPFAVVFTLLALAYAFWVLKVGRF